MLHMYQPELVQSELFMYSRGCLSIKRTHFFFQLGFISRRGQYYETILPTAVSFN